ncbi:MAG: Rpn family recombination-promoting nuclease/putative transposase [Bdellovibrionales bacterium]|nr:Rpn family recombination-promoting nuclease/putative transposase [Bdellovibrionales bacterium]
MNQIAKPRSLFLNLTQDLMFKNYFKLNKNLLKSLLKAFLPLPKNSFIKDIVILDSLIPSLSLEEKSSLMDLRVQLDSGEVVNVEMQAFPHKNFTNRVLLYWAKNYGSQIKIGEKYETLYPSYSLIFSTFDLFPKVKNFYTSFSIRSDVFPYFCFDKGLRIVTVELDKFKKREPSALLDLREEWCYLLKESKKMGERESKELSAKGQEMEEAMFHLKELSREEGLRLVEEARDKAWKDQMAREDDSFNRGIKQGIEQGMEKGIDKGKKELIMSMLKKGMEVSLLSKFTGLSEEEISKLQKSLS